MKRKHYFISFSIIVATFVLFQLSFIYYLYNDCADDIGNTAMNISKSVRETIDVNSYKHLIETREKNKYFYQMQELFTKVQQRTGAEYIYVERRLDDKEVEYIFDSSKDSFGERDENTTVAEYKMKNPDSFHTKIVTYKLWGKLISGFTPITDENGVVIGLVGVDFNLSFSLRSFYQDLQILIVYVSIMICYSFLFIFLSLKRGSKELTDINNFYDRIFKALCRSLEKKSQYTMTHSLKVAEYSVMLAKELNVKEEDLKIIKWAAELHDVGKIGISEKILNKPTKLTKEEYETIKTHPVYSREILDELFKAESCTFTIRQLKIITDIACFHHERWDGKGYPTGLSGEEIPYMARIVSIADAWEAMIADRPYRQSMDVQFAVEEMKANAGKQFDPKMVDAFLKCIEISTNTINAESGENMEGYTVL